MKESGFPWLNRVTWSITKSLHVVAEFSGAVMLFVHRRLQGCFVPV
jgi:hypothetical protein